MSVRMIALDPPRSTDRFSGWRRPSAQTPRGRAAAPGTAQPERAVHQRKIDRTRRNPPGRGMRRRGLAVASARSGPAATPEKGAAPREATRVRSGMTTRKLQLRRDHNKEL